MRIVIAEDQALLREGLARLFVDAGHEVIASLGDAEQLVPIVARHHPDLVVVDVRMPPTFSDEGARAAAEIKRRHGEVGVLVLSQHIETTHAITLVTQGGFGYLLKDRVLDVAEFLSAAERVARGGSALDPKVVASLVAPARDHGPFAALTEREQEVLGLMAEGLTNTGIASRLYVSERTVEAHVRHVLMKLGIAESEDGHRRVLAVLAYLRAADGQQETTLDPAEEFGARTKQSSPPVGRSLATVLFTDIVDSTIIASRLGDNEWHTVLDAHDDLVRELLSQHGGRLVKSTGDGMLATFDSPSRALECAVSFRDRAAGISIGIRAGVHTGEIEHRGDDIGGIAVHLAARVEACAQPGEVLTSQTVRDLVVGSRFRFHERGVHELKGIDGAWALYAVT